jgi:hypothetical protein
MKIPRKFRSSGLSWTVRYTDDIDNLGETDHDKQEILIRKSLSPEMREAVFFHEIGHTLNTTIDHPLLDSIAAQYWQVLKENKLIQ